MHNPVHAQVKRPPQINMPEAFPVERELNRELWVAAERGDLKKVEELKSKASVNWFNPWEPPGRAYQFTSLHVSAGNGHLEVVKFLVEKCGADFTAKASVRARNTHSRGPPPTEPQRSLRIATPTLVDHAR